ncbi:MAG: hypothetical protein ACI92E_002770 [Oceanicoccus sp.]|jgi:hypothetical protein
MQLKSKKSISGALAIATGALLGSGPVAHAEDHGWQIDTAFLYYDEKDKVSAGEPVISAKKRFDGDKILNLKWVADSLTGASPSGATATDKPQTFTRPSGKGEYTVPSGEIPLDDTFKDSRVGISVGWEQPWGRLNRVNVGGYFSNEYDYTSFAINAGISRDFNKRNTTLSVAVAYAFDEWDPEGGIPLPFASMAPAGADQPRQGDTDDKNITDILFGVTQVINSRTLMQLNYSFSRSSGYLTDPFKIVSVIDPQSGETLDNIYENRPEDRTKHSLYWKTKYHLMRGDTVDVSYRYMTDDWEIDSHTVDFRYRWNFSERYYVEPHVRYYQQSAAEFYRHSILEGEAVNLSEVSADNRLGEFDAVTIGVKYGIKFASGSELNVRLEHYEQTGDTSPSDAVGIQNNYDLFPDLEANIFQIGYSFKW